ncbi:MAG: hypothetical protein VZQ80_02240 [Lachnospiraceae bacterium]|nr:hypothetical protein [Lachnospiraceae bacterium]
MSDKNTKNTSAKRNVKTSANRTEVRTKAVEKRSGERTKKPAAKTTTEVRRENRARQKGRRVKESRMPVILLAVFIIYVIFAMVFAVNGLDSGVSYPAVGFFVLLEACLAALLFPIPLWIHGLVFLGQLIFGICFHKGTFMVLMALLYALAVAVIYFWTRKERAY